MSKPLYNGELCNRKNKTTHKTVSSMCSMSWLLYYFSNEMLLLS
jgi:hypothetical protein